MYLFKGDWDVIFKRSGEKNLSTLHTLKYNILYRWKHFKGCLHLISVVQIQHFIGNYLAKLDFTIVI